MITLATLKDATEQQVFDQVVRHMIKQGQRSVAGPGVSMCLYRGPEGLMCAAGCLIADDEYQPFFDNGSGGGGGPWVSLVTLGQVPSHHEKLIGELQRAHDQAGRIETVLEKMRTIGVSYNLNLDVFNHAG
jgi:hypothetical protein